MARLILSLDNQVLAEYNMTKERYTIGRLPDNDVRIDNPAVSGHHSLIINILNDSFLEDLNSTNGTYVNGKLIKKHALQHGDVITIGHHQLRFSDQQVPETEQDEFEKTMVIPTGQQNADQLARAEAAAEKAAREKAEKERRRKAAEARARADREAREAELAAQFQAEQDASEQARVIGAILFGYFLAITQSPQKITAWLVALDLGVRDLGDSGHQVADTDEVVGSTPGRNVAPIGGGRIDAIEIDLVPVGNAVAVGIWESRRGSQRCLVQIAQPIRIIVARPVLAQIAEKGNFPVVVQPIAVTVPLHSDADNDRLRCGFAQGVGSGGSNRVRAWR